MPMTIEDRIKRCNYLTDRAMLTTNPEQKEAYIERIDYHYKELLDRMEMANEDIATDLGVGGRDFIRCCNRSGIGRGMGGIIGGDK